MRDARGAAEQGDKVGQYRKRVIWMIYITGDTHGNQVMWDTCITPLLKKGDMIIVPGDFGIGFFNGKYWSEELFFDYIAGQEYMVLFCDGNHENFDKLNDYEISDWNGGKVHRICRNLIHLMRGEVYMLEGKKSLSWAVIPLRIKNIESREERGGQMKCPGRRNTEMRRRICKRMASR